MTPEDQQVALAAAAAVKIVVRGQGWVHVGQPALLAAGLDPHADPAKLQLFADGVEQAIAVTGNGDATFTADEAIEFYGVGRDTLWTDARTYWLIVGASGARVPVQTPPAGGAPPANFTYVERDVERTMYLAAVLNGDESNFFGAAISSTPTTKTLSIHHLDPAQAGAAIVRVSLQGVTALPHAVDVAVNGVAAGTIKLDPQAEGTFSFPVTNAVEGDNQITLTAEGAATNYTVVESVELDYGHTYAADNDTLLFTSPSGARLSIGGFSAPSVRVVDVTDETHPIELAATVTTQGTTSAAQVDVPANGATHTLLAFTAAAVLAPAAVVADAPSTWTASHDGELVILSHASFLSALAPLVARRAQEGWAVQLVDVQDVYDEQGFGDKTPAAIRAFVQTARATWRVPPRFVLLVGDATYDPRNFLGLGDFDFVPTELIDTAAMETASDDWFVDADLDGVPEVAIGRMPVRTAAEATPVVQKTLAYAGRADLPKGGLFVTDEDTTDLDFSSASATAETKVSDIMPVDSFHRGAMGDTPDVLLAKLGAGPFLVNYLGHGSVDIWDGLFSSDQASALTNTDASIYVVMNCLNGFFQDVSTTSLAEALLEAPHGGAVAVWASSTLAEFAPQPAYDQAFLMHVGRTSLGEAAVAAKQAIADVESRRTWLLFGDPTLFGTSLAAAAAADAGAADGGSRDGASADADGGALEHPSSSSGCGCRAGGAAPARSGGLGVLLAASAVAARRRRTRRPSRARRRWPLGAFALLCVALGGAGRAEAALGFRKSITIDRARIGTVGGATTLTSYPLLLDITDKALATTANGGHVQSANGYDITFVGADATTCGGPSTCTLNDEVESYTAATGRIIVWVQIPTLKTAANTSNTVIYAKYGDATVTSPTQNANGTWDASFKGVWHLDQNPGGIAPQMTDSTSTGASATSSGSPAPATAPGLIGSGVSLSSTTGTGYFEYRTTAFNWASTDTFTYSGWFQTTDGFGPLVSQRGNVTGGPVIDVMLGYNGVTTSSGILMTLVRDDTGGEIYASVTGAAAVNDGRWHLFTLTRNGPTIQLYLDGQSVGTGTGSSAGSSITTGTAGDFQEIGREGNWVTTSYAMANTDECYLSGLFDEYRISNTIRSIDWIATDYQTQSAPASTFSLGGEALATCGDGTVVAGEPCDDGNIVSGDGCSETCAIESGYTCTGTAPSVCSTTCGDGIVAGTEGCDDGNQTNGDGCSSACTIEPGYACTGSPSTCRVPTYGYYKTIAINHALVGTAAAPATLTHYPFLFSVTDTSLKTVANGGRVSSANGYDIIFQGVDPTTCGGAGTCTLAHEIETYDGTMGQLVAWVDLPALKTQTSSADTSIEILFGNPSIAASTEAVTSVWDSSFTGVWHLQQDPAGPAPQMSDSTSNGNDGTATSATATSSGRVGPGVSMNGSTSFIALSSGSSLSTPSGGASTYSGWVNTSDAAGGILSFRAISSESTVDITSGTDATTMRAGKLMVLMRDDANSGVVDLVSPASIADGAWHFVTVTHSGTTMTLYLDATSLGSATVSSGAYTSNLRNLGREGRWVQDNYTTTSDEYFAGILDEFRVSSTARSIDWIVTDYRNQSSPSTFITYTPGVAGEVSTDTRTEAELVSVDATSTCAGTTVAWQTTDEARHVGVQRVPRGRGSTHAAQREPPAGRRDLGRRRSRVSAGRPGAAGRRTDVLARDRPLRPDGHLVRPDGSAGRGSVRRERSARGSGPRSRPPHDIGRRAPGRGRPRRARGGLLGGADAGRRRLPADARWPTSDWSRGSSCSARRRRRRTRSRR